MNNRVDMASHRNGAPRRTLWLAVATIGLLAAAGCKKSSQMCTEVKCNAPPCCGETCGPGGTCCNGTFCSDNNLCVPESCQFCEGTECKIDTSDCSGECVVSSDCCLKSCSSDSPDDCCAGTICDDRAGPGTGICVPYECAFCGGGTTACRVNDACEARCEIPDSCGRYCETEDDCDHLTTCFEFRNGARACMPPDEAELCRECDTGCRFDPIDCQVDCRPVDPPDVDAGISMPPDAGPPGPDAAPPPDAGPTPDAAPPPQERQCRACCQPCELSTDCCPGSFCGESLGSRICMPDECQLCGEYGCQFDCP